MDGRFDPRLSSVFVFGAISGPTGRIRVRLAVDTGATRTVIRSSILRYVGYDPAASVDPVRMTSATGVQRASLVGVLSVDALGHSRALSVVAYELPATFEGHGLLGRDFFARQVLTIDFARGLVSLRGPKAWWQFWR